MNVTPKKQPSPFFPLAMSFVALAGAVGSVGLTLRAGHRNNSLILMALFATWVLSPLVALVLAGLYPGDALWRDADSHGRLAGNLLECGFDAAGFEACFPIPDGSAGVMVAYSDSHSGSRAHIKQTATYETGEVADQGGCSGGDVERPWNRGLAGIAVAGS